LIHRWFDEVWNQRREAAIDAMMVDDVVAKGLPPEPLDSREAFRQFYRLFLAAFPELHISVEEVISRGDRLAYRARLRATHRSGRSCDADGAGFVRIRRGRLTAGHNIWNFHELLERLQAVAPNAVMKAVRSGEAED
jgi:ketosteroid isomerase-like protein